VLVVPPHTDPDHAHASMMAAAGPGQRTRPSRSPHGQRADSQTRTQKLPATALGFRRRSRAILVAADDRAVQRDPRLAAHFAYRR